MDRKQIIRHYQENRNEIEQRLEEFESVGEENDYRLFMELAFVILTSQSSAKKSWAAVEELDNRNLLSEGGREEIAEVIAFHEIQYEERKADYIVSNREMLSQPTLQNPTKELKLRDRVDGDPEKTRKWMVENLKGVGWKGASHFLRNVGIGEFAIISNYILKSLYSLEIVEDVEPPKNEEEYLNLEEKLEDLSAELEIPLDALDLVLWSMETGEIFK